MFNYSEGITLVCEKSEKVQEILGWIKVWGKCLCLYSERWEKVISILKFLLQANVNVQIIMLHKIFLQRYAISNFF